MTSRANIESVYAELETGINLPKCQKCGCMQETLDSLSTLLPGVDDNRAQPLADRIKSWVGQMQPLKYSCLGCEHCYPAVAQNTFAAAFPSIDHSPALSCDFQVYEASWPPVVGEYLVLNRHAPVTVSTLASVDLIEQLAEQKPEGLALVGKTETENIGLDKIVKNIITNASIQYLIVAGTDSTGHRSGETLLALAQHGIDASGQVINSPGKRPALSNVSAEEVNAFRRQVQVIDMIGCNHAEEIAARIAQLAQESTESCGCGSCSTQSTAAVSIAPVPTITADEPNVAVKLDRAGYFVILPLANKGIINVEHYDYNNTLLRVVEGTTARQLYKTILTNGWVTELSHAAYLGRELTRAELSLVHGFKYVQDGA